MLSLISQRLLEQQEDVRSILDASVESRQYISKANDQLRAATSRPRSLRDVIVTILLLFAAVLLFLHWFYP